MGLLVDGARSDVTCLRSLVLSPRPPPPSSLACLPLTPVTEDHPFTTPLPPLAPPTLEQACVYLLQSLPGLVLTFVGSRLEGGGLRGEVERAVEGAMQRVKEQANATQGDR